MDYASRIGLLKEGRVDRDAAYSILLFDTLSWAVLPYGNH